MVPNAVTILYSVSSSLIRGLSFHRIHHNAEYRNYEASLIRDMSIFLSHSLAVSFHVPDTSKRFIVKCCLFGQIRLKA